MFTGFKYRYQYGYGLGSSLAERLIAEAQVAGADLALTNTSSGNRKSGAVGGDVRANNLVAAKLDTWNSIGSSTTLTDLLDGSYRAQMAVGSGTYIGDLGAAPYGAGDITVSFDIKNNGGANEITIRLADDLALTNEIMDEDVTITDDWQTYTYSSTAVGTTQFMLISDNGVAAADFLIRNVRLTATADPVTAFPDGSGAGYTKVDSLTLSSIPLVFSMAAATNLVSTVLTDWTKVNSTVDPIGLDSEYRLYDDSTSGAHFIRYEPVSYVDKFTCIALEAKADSITNMLIEYVNKADVGKSVKIDLTDGSISDNTMTNVDVSMVGDLAHIVVSNDAGSGAFSEKINILTINSSGDIVYVGSGNSLLLRNVRVIDDTAVSHAAFVDGSGAAEAYAVDKITCTPTYAASGWMALDFQTYGWAGTGNPVDAACVLFDAGTFQVLLDASGFFSTSGGAVSTKKPVDGTNHVLIITWDGVNHTISVDGETAVSNASAIAPSGTTYIGNVSAGNKVDHSANSALIWGEAPTEADKTAIYDYMKANLGVTFQ